jgi:hypothetical protein
MQASVAASHAPPRLAVSQGWIRSPWWDAHWLFSGLWAPASVLAIYAVLYGAPLHAPAFHTERFVLFFTGLGVLHRLSSIHAVLLSPILRDEVRANRPRYVFVPLAILSLTLLLAQALVFHPAFAFLGTTHGQLWAFFVLALALICWDRWHFCMQEFGVLSLYRARAGQSAVADRRFDRVYVVVLMLLVNSVLYVRAGFGDDVQILWRWLAVDPQTAQPLLEMLARAACSVALLLMAAALLRELRHARRSWPKLCYYVLIGGHSLCLYALPHALSLFFLSYVFHHWMVAVGLFNRVISGAPDSSSWLQRCARYARQVGPWLVLLTLASVFLAPLDLTGKLTPLPSRELFAGASAAVRFSAGLVIGFFFSFSFLHYYYDRCLYSFSVPGVRRVVAPLLLRAAPLKER